MNRSTTDSGYAVALVWARHAGGAAPAAGPIATLLAVLLALAVDWRRQEVAV